MTPLSGIDERVEETANMWDRLRTQLTGAEKERFDLELFTASRSGSVADVRFFMEAWSATVIVRDHPDYSGHYEGFMALVRSGHPYGETSQAQAI